MRGIWTSVKPPCRSSLDPTSKGRKRWMNRWKPALNAFAITFEDTSSPPTMTTTNQPSYTENPTVPVVLPPLVAGSGFLSSWSPTAER